MAEHHDSEYENLSDGELSSLSSRQGSEHNPPEGDGGKDEEGVQAMIDDYDDFHSDHARYWFDQKKYEAIENPKGQGPRQNPRRKTNQKRQRTRDTSLGVSFDKNGKLLWRHRTEAGDLVEEPAVFHHWIRRQLATLDNIQGQYDHPEEHKAGVGRWNITSYCPHQRRWGSQRKRYASLIFEFEKLDRKDPKYPLKNLYYEDRLVIDWWQLPVRNFKELPLVISSDYAGAHIEPALRSHGEMTLGDIRARMPPFIVINSKGKRTITRIWTKNALSGRARRFREAAGAISWDVKTRDSDPIKQFILSCASQSRRIGNSMWMCEDLSPEELRTLRKINQGMHPERRRKTSTKEAQDRYATLLAGSASAGPSSSRKTKAIPAKEEPERHVYATQGPPWYEYLTPEEAMTHLDIDWTDSRHDLPQTATEVRDLRQALDDSIAMFVQVIGVEPGMNPHRSYLTQYFILQSQYDEALQPLNLDQPLYLVRRKRWTGGISRWRDGEIGDGNPTSTAQEQSLAEEAMEEMSMGEESVGEEDEDGMEVEQTERSVPLPPPSLTRRPTTEVDIDNLQYLLHPTLQHFAHLTGIYNDQYQPTGSYAEEYEGLRQRLKDYWQVNGVGESPPLLFGLANIDERSAVWNQPWDRRVVGDYMDLIGITEQQLDANGNRVGE